MKYKFLDPLFKSHIAKKHLFQDQIKLVRVNATSGYDHFLTLPQYLTIYVYIKEKKSTLPLFNLDYNFTFMMLYDVYYYLYSLSIFLSIIVFKYYILTFFIVISRHFKNTR